MGKARRTFTPEFKAEAVKLVTEQGYSIALPLADCQQLQLDPALGVPGLMAGVGGSAVATIAFPVWVWLDGQEYPCRLQADFAGQERILGRDVLNRLEILFRGPAGEVVVNP